MIILIIYIVGVLISILLAYYTIYTSASEGTYFTTSDLIQILVVGVLSWIGLFMVLSCILEDNDWKLWKLK